jgi:transposase
VTTNEELTEQSVRACLDELRLDAEAVEVVIDRIRDRLIWLYQGQGWVLIGYSTWNEMLDGEGVREVTRRMTAEEKRELNSDLVVSGMSSRAVAAVTGASQSTVSRASKSLESYDSSDRITTLDGKSRPRRQAGNRMPTTKTRRETEAVRQAIAAQPRATPAAVAQATSLTEVRVKRIAKDLDHQWPLVLGGTRRRVGVQARKRLDNIVIPTLGNITILAGGNWDDVIADPSLQLREMIRDGLLDRAEELWPLALAALRRIPVDPEQIEAENAALREEGAARAARNLAAFAAGRQGRE